MKCNRFAELWTGLLTLGVALAVYPPASQAQTRGAEQLLRQPEQETQEPGVRGSRAEAERQRDEARRSEAESAKARAERKEQLARLQQELQESRARLKELSAAGKRDEAAKVEQHIRDMESDLALQRKGFRSAGPERRPERRVPVRRDRLERNRMDRRAPGDGRQPPPGEIPETQRRLQHLQVAIENLHAAGLHEPAEHLAQEARRMREQLQAPSPPREPGARRGGRPAESELEPLRQEIRNLHEAIQDLQRRMDELSRERR